MNLNLRSLSFILGYLFVHESCLEAFQARNNAVKKSANQSKIDLRALAAERAAKLKVNQNQVLANEQAAAVEIEGQPGSNASEAAAPAAQAVAPVVPAPAAGGEVHNRPEGPVQAGHIDLHVPHNLSIIGRDWVNGDQDDLLEYRSFNDLRAAQHAQNHAHMIVRVVIGEGTVRAPYFPHYYDANSFHRIMSDRDRLQQHAAHNLQAAMDEANGEPVADNAQRGGPAEPNDRNFKLWHKKERITYFICYPGTNHYEYAGSFSDLRYQLIFNRDGGLSRDLANNGYNIPLAREAIVNSEEFQDDQAGLVQKFLTFYQYDENMKPIRNVVKWALRLPDPDARPERRWYHYVSSLIGMGALGVLHGFINNIWARNRGEGLKNWHWNRAPAREWLTGFIFKIPCDELLINAKRNPLAISKGEHFFEALLYALYGTGQFYAERLALSRLGYPGQRDGAMNFAFVDALLSLLWSI